MRAIFTRDFAYSSRVSPFGWAIKASPEPQSFPQEVIKAAIARGAAVPAPKRTKPKT
jgi:hypothetical protein